MKQKLSSWYRKNNLELAMVILLVGWTALLPSCAKEAVALPEQCTSVKIYSDKYTIDTVYLRTDLLYKDCLTGINLERCRAAADQWFLLCIDYPDGFKLERLRHIIGNATKPIYKKK